MECDICGAELTEDEQYVYGLLEEAASQDFTWRLCDDCDFLDD
jgi:hypothetical protein